MLVLLAVAVPWFWLVSVRNPEFTRSLASTNNWQRYTSGVHSRPGPILLLATGEWAASWFVNWDCFRACGVPSAYAAGR